MYICTKDIWKGSLQLQLKMLLLPLIQLLLPYNHAFVRSNSILGLWQTLWTGLMSNWCCMIMFCNQELVITIYTRRFFTYCNWYNQWHSIQTFSQYTKVHYDIYLFLQMSLWTRLHRAICEVHWALLSLKFCKDDKSIWNWLKSVMMCEISWLTCNYPP